MTRADADFIESGSPSPDNRASSMSRAAAAGAALLWRSGDIGSPGSTSRVTHHHARRERPPTGLTLAFDWPTSGDSRSRLVRCRSVLGNSFGYLDIDDAAFALARAIRPGGGLVIDFNCTAETVLPRFTGGPRTMRTGDILVEIGHRADVAGSRLIGHYAFTRGASTQHRGDSPRLDVAQIGSCSSGITLIPFAHGYDPAPRTMPPLLRSAIALAPTDDPYTRRAARLDEYLVKHRRRPRRLLDRLGQ